MRICRNVTLVTLVAAMTVTVTLHGSDVKPCGSVQRDKRSGKCWLTANSQVGPVTFRILALWRYDPDSDLWTRDKFEDAPRTVRSGPVAELTDKVGLFWVLWEENEVQYGSLVFSGPGLCNDVDLGPPARADLVAACIPLKDGARAAYVPDPKVYCK